RRNCRQAANANGEPGTVHQNWSAISRLTLHGSAPGTSLPRTSSDKDGGNEWALTQRRISASLLAKRSMGVKIQMCELAPCATGEVDTCDRRTGRLLL